MVLEDIFKADAVRHRPYLSFFFGFFFSLIAFAISVFFFKDSLSIAVVFLTTLLLVPALMLLLKREENVEGQFGIKNFFSNHKDIFESYLFSFLGIFAAFILLGFFAGGSLFSFQEKFLKFLPGMDSSSITEFVRTDSVNSTTMLFDILFSNLLVLLICFILSFLYGASAIFLIILNGGVFASFIVLAIRTLASDLSGSILAFSIFSLHLLPEVSGFLVAAIAGGVVSKSVTAERFGSERFRNVCKDGTILLLIAAGLIVVGALIEVFMTARLFQAVF